MFISLLIQRQDVNYLYEWTAGLTSSTTNDPSMFIFSLPSKTPYCLFYGIASVHSLWSYALLLFFFIFLFFPLFFSFSFSLFFPLSTYSFCSGWFGKTFIFLTHIVLRDKKKTSTKLWLRHFIEWSHRCILVFIKSLYKLFSVERLKIIKWHISWFLYSVK